MAKGVSGYIDFAAPKGFTLRIHYEETYDFESNTSPEFAITKVQVARSEYSPAVHYLDGTIVVNGTTAVSMSSFQGTHNVNVEQLGVFYDVRGTLGSVRNIVHEADGSKSIPITVSVSGTTLDGKAGSGWKATGTQYITLTTIPRASEITYAGNVTLGNACKVK